MRRNPVTGTSSSLHATNNNLSRQHVTLVNNKGSGYHSLQQSLQVAQHGTIVETALQQVSQGKVASSIQGLSSQNTGTNSMRPNSLAAAHGLQNSSNLTNPNNSNGHQTIRNLTQAQKDANQLQLQALNNQVAAQMGSLHRADITFDHQNQPKKANKANYNARGSQLYAFKKKSGGNCDSKSQGMPLNSTINPVVGLINLNQSNQAKNAQRGFESQRSNAGISSQLVAITGSSISQNNNSNILTAVGSSQMRLSRMQNNQQVLQPSQNPPYSLNQLHLNAIEDPNAIASTISQQDLNCDPAKAQNLNGLERNIKLGLNNQLLQSDSQIVNESGLPPVAPSAAQATKGGLMSRAIQGDRLLEMSSLARKECALTQQVINQQYTLTALNCANGKTENNEYLERIIRDKSNPKQVQIQPHKRRTFQRDQQLGPSQQLPPLSIVTKPGAASTKANPAIDTETNLRSLQGMLSPSEISAEQFYKQKVINQSIDKTFSLNQIAQKYNFSSFSESDFVHKNQGVKQQQLIQQNQRNGNMQTEKQMSKVQSVMMPLPLEAVSIKDLQSQIVSNQFNQQVVVGSQSPKNLANQGPQMQLIGKSQLQGRRPNKFLDQLSQNIQKDNLPIQLTSRTILQNGSQERSGTYYSTHILNQLDAQNMVHQESIQQHKSPTNSHIPQIFLDKYSSKEQEYALKIAQQNLLSHQDNSLPNNPAVSINHSGKPAARENRLQNQKQTQNHQEPLKMLLTGQKIEQNLSNLNQPQINLQSNSLQSQVLQYQQLQQLQLSNMSALAPPIPRKSNQPFSSPEKYVLAGQELTSPLGIGQVAGTPTRGPLTSFRQAIYSQLQLNQEQMAQNGWVIPRAFYQEAGTNFHFMYDYLIVQVSAKVYERDYLSRIKLYPNMKGPLQQQNQSIPQSALDVEDNKLYSGLQSPIDEDSRSVEQILPVEKISHSNYQNQSMPMLLDNEKQISYDTQFDLLSVILESDLQETQELPTMLNQTSQYLLEQNKKFKITVKKNYINDILCYAKGAVNVAQKVLLIVNENQSVPICESNKKQGRVGAGIINGKQQKLQVKQPLAGGAADSDSDAISQQLNGGINSRLNTPSHILNRKARGKLIAQTRGYESENEPCSRQDSATTASGSQVHPQNGLSNKHASMTPMNKQHGQSQKYLLPKKKTDHLDSEAPGKGNSGGRKSDINSNHMAGEKGVKKEAVEQKYGPTKIKILHPYEKPSGLRLHKIQKMFDAYNEFVKIVFTQRADYGQKYNDLVPRLLKLVKRLGITLQKGQLRPENLKTRENYQCLKEKVYFAWCKTLSEENQFQADEVMDIFLCNGNKVLSEQVKVEQEHARKVVQSYQEKTQYYYKCFVGKGNNGMLIRSLFKNRYWWLMHDKEEPEKVNFLWTQCRKQPIMQSLKCKVVKQGEGQIQVSPKKKKAKQIKQDQQNNNNATNPNSCQPAASSKNGGAPQSTDKPSKDSKNDQQIAQQSQALTQVEQQQAEKLANEQQQKQLQLEPYPLRIYNKLEDNYHLANKKALFINMRNYYEAIGKEPFDALPVTFHVKNGLEDAEFHKFKEYYDNQAKEKHNIWIIKPGECTNQGNGISVSKDWQEIQDLVSDSTQSKKRTCIIQKYIHNPLLINRRKFDIRTYAMQTCVNGHTKGYFYHEGYLRTSCREFSILNLSNKLVHLTNDAIQKRAEDYGKFEAGNKQSYAEFQHYIDTKHGDLSIDFDRDILSQIKKQTADCMRAVWGKMDPDKRVNTFEIFGLDFMIDDNFKVFLIEVNTNPCLELSAPLLARLIPNMLENSWRIVADPHFPPPEGFAQKKQVVQELCPENKYDLIFDEKIDGPELQALWKEKANIIVEMNEDEISDEAIDDQDE